MICLTVYNMLRGEKAPDKTLSDFLPEFGVIEEPEEEQHDLSSLEALAKALEAAVKAN